MGDGSSCAAPQVLSHASGFEPALGPTTDTYWEWYPKAHLAAALAAARLRVSELELERSPPPPPAADLNSEYDSGDRPTPKRPKRAPSARPNREIEKDINKATHRAAALTELDRMLTDSGGEIHASKLWMDSHGRPDPVSGRFRLPYKCAVRGMPVEYGRKPYMNGGRRYPKALQFLKPAAYEEESDRLVAPTIQGLPKDLRATLLGGLRDLDMVACHATIMQGLAKRHSVPVPSLDKFLEKPKRVREQAAGYHFNNTGPEAMERTKTCFQAMLYGGSYAYRMRKWKFAGPPHPLLASMETEVKALRDRLLEHPQYRGEAKAAIERQMGRESKFRRDASGHPLLKSREEAKKSAWSQICQRLEDEALRKVQTSLEARGVAVCALMFDGLAIWDKPEFHDADVLKKLLVRVSTDILKCISIALILEEKPLYSAELIAQYAE